MSGLVMADRLAYRRRMSAFSRYFSYIICVATFLLIPKGIGLTLVTLLILPMGAANLPVMIKEIDSGQAYTRYLLTFPCSRKEIVQSRFCASFLDGLQDMALVVLFLVIDALWRHTFTPLRYLQLGLASLMIGLIYMAMNLVVSFLGNVTVTSVFYMISVLAGMAVYILAVWLDAPVERLLSLNPLLLWGGCLTLTVLIVLVCYGISLKLFERRR